MKNKGEVTTNHRAGTGHGAGRPTLNNDRIQKTVKLDSNYEKAIEALLAKTQPKYDIRIGLSDVINAGIGALLKANSIPVKDEIDYKNFR